MTFADRYGNAIDFLMEKGNPAIQYRTMIELCEQYDVDVYRENLAHSERAVKWLDILRNHKEYHGATMFSVENSLNVLIDMGFRAGEGFREFDQLLNLLAEEVNGYEPDQNHILHNLYCHLVTVPFLARAGLLEDWIVNFITDRIEAIHHFVVQGDYDIYTDVSKYGSMPKAFQNRPIIKPELYRDGVFQFPLIYDIYGFAAIYPTLQIDQSRKVNQIVAYIMDDRFQSIEDGYGILRGKDRFYAMGWDPKPTDLTKDIKYNPLLQRMELLAVFDSGISSNWFAEAMEQIRQYADGDYRFSLPASFLSEKDSCWVLGCRMGLGQNRRKKDALTVEGTFRALRIIKYIWDKKVK